MPYTQILLHCVWSTKNREPYLANRPQRLALMEHILQNARNKGIFIDHIGGEKEHLHLLLSLGTEQNIARVMMLIKGESAHWFNSQYRAHLEWQNDYFAVSVSQSVADAVRKYIRGQEEHHRRKTFTEEYDEFISIYGFKREDWAKAHEGGESSPISPA